MSSLSAEGERAAAYSAQLESALFRVLALAAKLERIKESRGGLIHVGTPAGMVDSDGWGPISEAERLLLRAIARDILRAIAGPTPEPAQDIQAVYSRPDCQYLCCPNPDACKALDACQFGNKRP